MSNSRDLLKEAIADAKSVKEAAIANAKAALEEAFTPYLQEKFAAKLAEMEMEEEDTMEEAEMTDENYGEDGTMEERLGTLNDPDETGVGNALSTAPKGNLEEKDLDELDLEELLAELEEEERTEGMEKKTEESLTEAEEEEEMEMDSEEEMEGEDTEIDLEDMSEEDLKALIEDVIADMVEAGELEAGENYEEEEGDEEEEEVDIDMEDEESEEEVSEILKEEEEEVSEGMAADLLAKIGEKAPELIDIISSTAQQLQTSPEGLVTIGAGALGAAAIPALVSLFKKGKNVAVATMKPILDKAKTVKEAEVEEMRNSIEELASTLSEVKLLNAKLLYTNKIFRAKNLTESQKVKVLESFDKASSVKEAKLIYETLTTIKETKSPVTESMRGSASKAAGMAPEKKPILEVNDQFARWKVLAGIKK